MLIFVPRIAYTETLVPGSIESGMAPGGGKGRWSRELDVHPFREPTEIRSGFKSWNGGEMGQKILIAFDDSENAMRAVQYVAETYSPDNQITLFSVLHDTAALCDMNSPELTPYFKSQQQAFCTLEEKKKSLVSTALAKAKDLLLNAGFDGESISIKTEPKKKGIARDLVAEAKSGYDLVVIGRRGISGIKEYFFGSISQKVLQLLDDTSILIVN